MKSPVTNSDNMLALNAPDLSPKKLPHPRPLFKILPYLVGLLVGAGGASVGSYWAWHSMAPSQIASFGPYPALAEPTTQRLPIPSQGSNFITQVVTQAGAAVVRIDASRTVTQQVPDVLQDPFFKEFFGNAVPKPSAKQIERGVGSGFIVNANGQIITNAHVVKGVDTVQVTLKDGRTFKGKVLGADPTTDVAVVQIKADRLPTVKLGNSDKLQPGEWAIAIGNPLGLDNTVTAGIISATGRSSGDVGVPDERVNFIQTDTAINPGNSGGPLLNAQGEVIGVNTAIIQDAQSIGFAIPINTVQAITQQLIAHGSVSHAYLGIQMATLTPALKQDINQDPNSGLTVEEDKGILILKVMPDSPAAKAGVRAGDVITSLEGEAIANADRLQQAVEARTVNSTLRLGIRRNRQSTDVAVKLGKLPAPQADDDNLPG
ncbi:MAG: HhoA/HhoB/HtrA family serine endopeptidase [Thermosynechococcaceae cyanobacterium]